jgi:hypothetical protein
VKLVAQSLRYTRNGETTMSTALATVSNMSDASLHSEFPFGANVVPRDLVKSREFFVAFPQKFRGCLLERLLHFTIAEE